MKKIYLIGGIATLAVLFYAFAPEDRILLVKTKFNRLLHDPGQLCFDYHAIALKDPKTAEILEVSKISDSLSITYRAKNGFGAYGTDTFGCRLTNGEFTELNQRVESISSRLRAGISINKNEFDTLRKDAKHMTSADLKEVFYLEDKFYYLTK